MKRVEKTYQLDLDEPLKQGLLHWADHYEHFSWLDSNAYQQSHGRYEALLAVGSHAQIAGGYQGAFERLRDFLNRSADWAFGYLGYDLKNDLEALTSQNANYPDFPDLFFFVPQKLIQIRENKVRLLYLPAFAGEMDRDIEQIVALSQTPETLPQKGAVSMRLRSSRDSYFSKIETAKQHIDRGDIYEVNLCQEIYATNAEIDPLATFFHLNALSRPPFASFVKLKDRYVLSASPERFLQKTGNEVRSQPIKGTAGRGPDRASDQEVAQRLIRDPKERSENIMITDLVRNDLSRIAVKGSVEVEELCGVYTFEQVHQLISTIRCQVPNDLHAVDIVKACFPMGSMTGAPKISAMKIIEELEDARRGVYSGAIGYFTPGGDFDFNVVIRSILYNAAARYLSLSVGGAITAASTAEAEYQECLLKAKALREVLEGPVVPAS